MENHGIATPQPRVDVYQSHTVPHMMSDCLYTANSFMVHFPKCTPSCVHYNHRASTNHHALTSCSMWIKVLCHFQRSNCLPLCTSERSEQQWTTFVIPPDKSFKTDIKWILWCGSKTNLALLSCDVVKVTWFTLYEKPLFFVKMKEEMWSYLQQIPQSYLSCVRTEEHCVPSYLLSSTKSKVKTNLEFWLVIRQSPKNCDESIFKWGLTRQFCWYFWFWKHFAGAD